MLIKKGTPQMIQGNELFLKQILVNLIHNSVILQLLLKPHQTKFTKTGFVKTSVQLKPASKIKQKDDLQHSHYIVFKVKDSGIGIPPSTLQHLFQPFVQASRDDRGTGLGLSISLIPRTTNIFRLCSTIFRSDGRVHFCQKY